MARSGLQKEVFRLYRQGVRNAMSKPRVNALTLAQDVRNEFLVHLRYNFHHPPLTARDYTAIEHQLRKFSRTLDMLESPSVLRIHVSDDMRDWWGNEVARAHARAEKAALKKELGEGKEAA